MLFGWRALARAPPVRVVCLLAHYSQPPPQISSRGASAGPPRRMRRGPHTYPSVFAGAGWGCAAALAGARLRTSRAYPAGGIDRERDAADAGDAAAGFDFGDAARMAAEFAPVLSGAPAGQRRR